MGNVQGLPPLPVNSEIQLYLASQYTDEPSLVERFRDRASFFFDRCIEDLLSYSTSHLARPRIILASYGFLPWCFKTHPQIADRYKQECPKHELDFGEPSNFVRIGLRFRPGFRVHLADALREIFLLVRGKLYASGGPLHRRLRHH